MSSMSPMTTLFDALVPCADAQSVNATTQHFIARFILSLPVLTILAIINLQHSRLTATASHRKNHYQLDLINRFRRNCTVKDADYFLCTFRVQQGKFCAGSLTNIHNRFSALLWTCRLPTAGDSPRRRAGARRRDAYAAPRAG